jgi:methyl-accepting chemotaxis protein
MMQTHFLAIRIDIFILAGIGMNFKSKSKLATKSFQHMVEMMPVNIMICDLDNFEIIYANKSTLDTIREIEDQLPVTADKLVGTSIDIFHKNPEHQRQMLKDPSNLPHNARIRIGGEVLDLAVTALMDGDRYLAPMVTWQLVTEKVKSEEDTSRLLQMIDNMPLNVMLADPETAVITYANKTAIDTLRTIEQHLPIRADDLIGTCIDVFHQNPAHQRQIINDPARLPWKAKIKVGPEYLGLDISAIYGRDGTYIAPMLNWSVITKEVELADLFESDVAGLVAELKSSAEQLEATSTSMSAAVEETSQQSSVVASATEELSASSSDITRQVSDAETCSQEAWEKSQSSQAIIEELAESANKIGDVVKMISDIADQTNLLALNATIEAARAGEAGRGFAVVAQEVKALAGQTSTATNTIGQQIAQVQSSTGSVVSVMEGINNSLQDIRNMMTSVAAAAEEQSVATDEVSSNIQGVRDANGETSQNTVAVNNAAREVLDHCEELNSKVGNFLTSVRAMV